MTKASVNVIIIDDDRDFSASLKQLLEVEGHSVKVYHDPVAALRSISAEFNGVVLLDVRMPRASGEDVLKAILDRDAQLPIIHITGHGDIPMAVRALKQGAYGFFTKPLQLDDFMHDLQRALSSRSVELERRNLARQIEVRDDLFNIVPGTSAPMVRLRHLIAKTGVAGVDVLIAGETGSGKELVAQALHQVSGRKGSFIAINCGNISIGHSAEELFGYEDADSQGAERIQAGCFERANGGTLLLDEIESMPMETQVRLLRVLQERTVQRVNGIDEIPFDARIFAATKSDLTDLVAQGKFREDLFYRLNVVTLTVPPLRDRGADSVILFEHFLQTNTGSEQESGSITAELMSDLLSHDWPGNVRELKNAADRYSAGLQVFGGDDEQEQRSRANSLSVRVADYEKGLIEATLAHNKGSIKRTMLDLDVPRKTLHDKMSKYNIDREQFCE